MNVFEPFLDAEDLSTCVSAGETPAGLNARAEALGCFWPLWLDPGQNFGDLYLKVRATSRSFRYGWIGDNVLGLLWRLPSGRELRLGGRTVKNVTGFDLVRFFSASQERFGRPSALILRLRPRAEARLNLRLSGSWSGLRNLARSVRGSSWAHALESCDLRAEAKSAAIVLGFEAKASLLPLFRAQAETWSREHALVLAESPADALVQAEPWARMQAPLDDCVGLAEEWLVRYGGTIHGFLGQGLLQLEAPGSIQGAEQGLHELHRRLSESGGHCEHPSLTADPDAPQARWERELSDRLDVPT
ncbi:MAG: FAD-binding oxidoreductase [bacterium]